jgi:hypothetical protein
MHKQLWTQRTKKSLEKSKNGLLPAQRDAEKRNAMKVRCAICRFERNGDQQDDLLMSLGAQRQEDGSFKKVPICKQVRGFWLCVQHKNEPLNYQLGTKIVATINASGIPEIHPIEKIRDTGFTIRNTSYNIFGVRTRGFGHTKIVRVATAEDIQKEEEHKAAQKRQREESDAHRKALEARGKQIEAAFRKKLDKSLDGFHVMAWHQGGDIWEITMHLKATDLGVAQ